MVDTLDTKRYEIRINFPVQLLDEEQDERDEAPYPSRDML